MKVVLTEKKNRFYIKNHTLLDAFKAQFIKFQSNTNFANRLRAHLPTVVPNRNVCSIQGQLSLNEQ